VAGSDGDELPLAREAFERTVRLVANARLREAVIAPLADDDDDLDARGVRLLGIRHRSETHDERGRQGECGQAK